MRGLALLLRPLKLLQSLHDCAVGEAFLVLDRGHSALLQAFNLAPHAACLLFVLSRAERQLVPASVVCRVSSRLIRILLRRLHYRRTRWNQIQIAPLELLLKCLNNFALSLGKVRVLRLLARGRILIRLLWVVPHALSLSTRWVRCTLRGFL